MKRCLVLILVATIILVCLPTTGLATQTSELSTIWVNQGHLQKYSVILKEKDILFSGEDLEIITGYTYRIDGNNAVFSRGSKILNVNLTSSKLTPMVGLGFLTDKTFDEKIQQLDGKYYYPASQMLPWMNVTCFVEKGALYIVADAVSYWDFIEGFQPEEHSFDYNNCCRELGVNNKWLKASAYVMDNGLGMFFDVVPMSWDATYGSFRDYYDIFNDFFTDKSSSAYAFKELTGKSKKIKSTFDMIDDLGELDNLPDELRALSAWVTAVDKISDFTDIAIFCASCQADNQEKLNCMESISLNRETFEYPEALVSAAMQIHSDYENMWTGIKTQIAFKLGDAAFDALVSSTGGAVEAIAKIIGAPSKIKVSWKSAVARMGKYDAIANSCLTAFEQMGTPTHQASLQGARCQALLYLYASEQNWRAMANFAESKNKTALAQQYLGKAEAALEWQGKFLAAAAETTVTNDSHEYGNGIAKQGYTDKLLEMFAELRGTVPQGVDELVGVWNLYDGGYRDNQGNWSDLYAYTIALEGDGTASAAVGIDRGEWFSGYSGLWQAKSIGDNQYQLQLDLIGGEMSMAENSAQSNCCVTLIATLDGDLMTLAKQSGDETCLLYDRPYEKNLSSDTWKERQENNTDFVTLDNSYLGDWIYAPKSNLLRKLSITKIEGNTICFDLHYYPQASFWKQTATIDNNGVAHFRAENQFFAVTGTIAFGEELIVTISQSNDVDIPLDTKNFAQRERNNLPGMLTLEEWYSMTDKALKDRLIDLSEKIITTHDVIDSVTLVLDYDGKVLHMQDGRRNITISELQVDADLIENRISIYSSADCVWFYIKDNGNKSWQYTWTGEYVGGESNCTLPEYLLSCLDTTP